MNQAIVTDSIVPGTLCKPHVLTRFDRKRAGVIDIHAAKIKRKITV